MLVSVTVLEGVVLRWTLPKFTGFGDIVSAEVKYAVTVSTRAHSW